MSRGLFGLAVLLAAALPAAAQPAKVPPTKLTVQPAAAPKPALKYLLFPEVRDLTPGNAALAYQRAHNPEWWHGAPKTDKDWDALQQALELPLSQLGKAVPWPPLPTLALREVDLAARREACDWELLARLRKDGIGTLMGDIQTMRTYAHLLAVRARLELAEGQSDKALYTYQTMLAMSRHITEGPTLINALVAAAVANLTLGRVEEFIEQPGAPNLYWALAALPQPFIDLRRALETEKIMVEVHFPDLKKLDKGPLTAGEMDRLVEVCINVWAGLEGANVRKAGLAQKVELVGKVVQAYPAARKALIDQGRTAAEVEALPMLQVVVLHHYQRFRVAEDDVLKWTYLPYAQGHKGMKEAVGRLTGAEALRDELWPFTDFLFAVEKVGFAAARVDRHIAALRCLEAVRLYAAAHGPLPKALDDITEVPIPSDPVTGRPFQYTAAGDVFTLYGPPPSGEEAREGNTIHYQVTVKR
jgi:hypothetical protein